MVCGFLGVWNDLIVKILLKHHEIFGGFVESAYLCTRFSGATLTEVRADDWNGWWILKVHEVLLKVSKICWKICGFRKWFVPLQSFPTAGSAREHWNNCNDEVVQETSATDPTGRVEESPLVTFHNNPALDWRSGRPRGLCDKNRTNKFGLSVIFFEEKK